MANNFPFSAIVSQDEMKRAILICAIDPSIGGVLVFGDRGTGKSTAVRALAALLPKMQAVVDCPYNCDPLRTAGLCARCVGPDAASPPKGRQVAVPVVDMPLGATEDRVVGALGDHPEIDELLQAGVPVVQLAWSGPHQLAGEVARWEFATAVAGVLLGINPFDQPNVQAAKTATARVLEMGEELPPTTDPATVLDTLQPGDLLGLLAFVVPDSEDEARVHAAADVLRRRTGVPVTVGIGPRYLHSTGQLHKGGSDRAAFLIMVGDDPEDAEIPGKPYGFSRLKRAQAAGDHAALTEAGRRVAHVRLEDLPTD